MNTGALRKHISRSLKESVRVYALELTEISRGLGKKAEESPVLYAWFSLILIFSVVMAARFTVLEMNTSFPINMEQIFFAVFFLFILKSSADFHRYFVDSRRIEYLFASPISHFSTSSGIFLGIFWINLGLWSLFSSAYISVLFLYGIPIGYPTLYLKFTLGVAFAIILGVIIAIHYFSPKRRLMLIPVLLISALWYFHEIIHILILISLTFPYFLWALKISPASFGYVVRKERRSAVPYSKKPRNPVEAMRWKEITVLWRDRLVLSFLITAVSVGAGSGYLAIHMDTSIFPAHLRPYIVPALPFIFLFLGIFILSSYLFIFPALNTFLAEEKTLWLLKNLPASGKLIVSGKTGAMVLPFLTSLAFPFYFSIFTGLRFMSLTFSILILSFFLSTAISIPFGIRYAGKKSDVLLLYTISILLFTVLSIGAYAIKKSMDMGFLGALITIFILDWSAFILYLSVEYSGRMMDRKWVG